MFIEQSLCKKLLRRRFPHDGINIYGNNKDAMRDMVKIIKGKSNTTLAVRGSLLFINDIQCNQMQNALLGVFLL